MEGHWFIVWLFFSIFIFGTLIFKITKAHHGFEGQALERAANGFLSFVVIIVALGVIALIAAKVVPEATEQMTTLPACHERADDDWRIWKACPKKFEINIETPFALIHKRYEGDTKASIADAKDGVCLFVVLVARDDLVIDLGDGGVAQDSKAHPQYDAFTCQRREQKEHGIDPPPEGPKIEPRIAKRDQTAVDEVAREAPSDKPSQEAARHKVPSEKQEKVETDRHIIVRPKDGDKSGEVALSQEPPPKPMLKPPVPQNEAKPRPEPEEPSREAEIAPSVEKKAERPKVARPIVRQQERRRRPTFFTFKPYVTYRFVADDRRTTALNDCSDSYFNIEQLLLDSIFERSITGYESNFHEENGFCEIWFKTKGTYDLTVSAHEFRYLVSRN